MIRAFLDWIRPPPVTDWAALTRFLSGEASYLAQRATYEFCRNTLAWYGQHHFARDDFNDVFRACRWEAFAAILADMTILTEARLRPAAGEGRDRDGQELIRGMAACFAGGVGEYPVPAHRPQGWGELIGALERRLGEARLAGTTPQIPALGRVTARRVYEVSPVRSENAVEDQRVIENAIVFGLTAFHDRMTRRLRPPAILAAAVPVAIS